MYNLNTYPTIITESTVMAVAITVGMIEGGDEADQFKQLRICK